MAKLEFIDPSDIQDAALKQWYQNPPDEIPSGEDLRSLILAQHYCNFRLWGLEDEARRRDVDDSVIASIKRSIDGWNQNRNDLMEVLDEAFLTMLPPVDTLVAEQNSESAGQIIDRLSILSLKIWHMSAHAARRDDADLAAECAGKLAVLKEQRRDLSRSLKALLDGCMEGRRFFKLYRQFKAYNDPRLNPALASRR